MQSGSSSWSRRNQGAAVEADAIREKQLRQTQSGSSSWSRCNQGEAVEADAIREQQLKQMQSGRSSWSRHNQGAAVEADAIREQQLKQMQSGRSSWSWCNQGAAVEASETACVYFLTFTVTNSMGSLSNRPGAMKTLYIVWGAWALTYNKTFLCRNGPNFILSCLWCTAIACITRSNTRDSTATH